MIELNFDPGRSKKGFKMTLVVFLTLWPHDLRQKVIKKLPKFMKTRTRHPLVTFAVDPTDLAELVVPRLG